ncbi:MAG TPA: aminotransferase class V-fold PLP-dependent enzyme [Paludibaculum sp.]|jgi:selenocysteine lyase/cysteine desulfurase
MGYNDSTVQEIWRTYRPEFPVTDNLLYLNHAAVAPLARRAAEAMKWLADDALHNGSLHYDKWLESYDGLRAAMGKLIHAEPGEIAMVKNTSEGIATVALGLAWQPGDKIVAFREEFPANYYIWKKLEEWKGVRVEWLSYLDSLETIEQAARGAKLLAISFVQYLSGYRADLTAIGEICRRHGVFFFVDAIQGMGAFPLDVRAMNIQALAADGHKWLLGPEGCGVLYVQQDWQDRIEPMEFGWTTVAGFVDYSSRDMAVRRDAGRYECGTLNTVGCFGLRASTELILEVGVENIAPHVQHLGDLIADGARARGYEVMMERTPATGAGIVCIRKAGTDARVTHAHLKARGIMTAPRQGWVRISPHFYISPDDISRLLSELP